MILNFKMSSVLELIAECLSITDVAEMLIRNYLPGDDCLDDSTLKTVFKRPYRKRTRSITYLDPHCTVLHSFNGNPSIDGPFDIGGLEYHRNGKLHRDNDKPAVVNQSFKEWYRFGKLHRHRYPALISYDDEEEWYENGNLIFHDENTECLHEKYTDINYKGELDEIID